MLCEILIIVKYFRIFILRIDIPVITNIYVKDGAFTELEEFSLSSQFIKFYFSLYLPNLQSFEVYHSFEKTTSLSLSSNPIQFYFRLNLPNLQSFKTGNGSFSKVTSLSLSGNSIKLTLVYIFLIYNHSKQDGVLFLQQKVYLCQVILSNSTLY